MRSYVISKSEYGGQAGEKGKIYQEDAPTLYDLLVRIFGESEVEDQTDNDFVKMCERDNGDGQPYYMIYDLCIGQQVFG